MTLEDVTTAGEIVVSRVSPTARVSWGARVNSKMQGAVRVTVVLAGVDSPFLVKGLEPFGVLSRKTSEEGKEVNVIEKTEKNEGRKGFFGIMRS